MALVKPKVYTGVTAALYVGGFDDTNRVAYATGFTLDLTSNTESFNVLGQRFQEQIPTYNTWSASTDAKASFENQGQRSLLSAYQNQDFIWCEFIINQKITNGVVEQSSYVMASGYASIESISISAGEGVTDLSISLTGSGNLGFKLPTYVPVSSVEVTPATLSLRVGDSSQLGVAVLPDNASEVGLVWTTSDATKATVDENGFVIAVAATASETPVVITATSVDDDEVKDTCSVTISAS